MTDKMALAIVSASAALLGSVFGAGGSILIEMLRQKRDDRIRTQKTKDAIRIRKSDVIEKAVIDLIQCTDPHIEYGQKERVERMLPLVLRLQLALDLDVKEQNELNTALNHLALAVQEQRGEGETLRCHGNMIDSAKAVLLGFEKSALA